jgi:hypothetical protein
MLTFYSLEVRELAEKDEIKKELYKCKFFIIAVLHVH